VYAANAASPNRTIASTSLSNENIEFQLFCIKKLAIQLEYSEFIAVSFYRALSIFTALQLPQKTRLTTGWGADYLLTASTGQ
jgi:hypothetical protein